MQLVSLVRDFREFLAAKKRKREPIRLRARGGAAATYVPRHAQGFANFRGALRGVGHWGQASERLDAVEHQLMRSRGVGLPLPRKVLQNEDRSLSVFWEGFSVRCFTDGIVSLLGGTQGLPAKGVTRELLDALEFQAKLQVARCR